MKNEGQSTVVLCLICQGVVFLSIGCSAEGVQEHRLSTRFDVYQPEEDASKPSIDSSFVYSADVRYDSSNLTKVNLEEDASCAATSSEAEQIFETITETHTEVTPQPVTINIMLDISISMTWEGGQPPRPDDPPPPVGSTKAEVAVASILDFINDPASEGIAVALNYFPIPFVELPVPEDPEDELAICPATGFDSPAVPVGRLPDPNQVKAITDSLNTMEFSAWGTPIQPALAGVTSYCKQFKQDDPFGTGEDCVAVFITDGLPQFTQCSADSTLISDIAGDAFNDPDYPVMTFAIGMAGADFALLHEIAKKGGTDCTPSDTITNACNVSQGMTLLQALELIREYVTDEIVEVREEVTNIPVECEWQIPEPEGDEEFNKDYVNIQFVNDDTGEVQEIGKVMDESECPGNLGWYYDNNDNPTKIIACKETTCPQIQKAVSGRVDILLGCWSKVL